MSHHVNSLTKICPSFLANLPMALVECKLSCFSSDLNHMFKISNTSIKHKQQKDFSKVQQSNTASNHKNLAGVGGDLLVSD